MCTPGDIIRDEEVGREELCAVLYPKNIGPLTYTVK
jgi:hypothetical protein